MIGQQVHLIEMTSMGPKRLGLYDNERASFNLSQVFTFPTFFLYPHTYHCTPLYSLDQLFIYEPHTRPSQESTAAIDGLQYFWLLK